MSMYHLVSGVFVGCWMEAMAVMVKMVKMVMGEMSCTWM